MLRKIPLQKAGMKSLSKHLSAAADRDFKLKPKEFYEEAARRRNYFYVIDLKGQLFLEDCQFRNFTSCLKDPKFLSSFFQQLRQNNSGARATETSIIDSPSNYQYISPCGKEINFVSQEDPHSALGFIGLEETGDITELIYPGNIAKEKLNPVELAFSSETGRLYHTITALPRLKGCQGLLHPSLCQILGELITHDVDSGRYLFDWLGQRYELRTIESNNDKGLNFFEDAPAKSLR